MKSETFTIGERQFSACKMNAFDAGRFLLKLNHSFAPALLESVQQGGEGVNLFDVLLNLDENMHEEVIFPILTAARTYSLEDNRKVNSAIDMNFCFTVDNLFDFYLLVWEVLKLNFAPFIERAASHFGNPDFSLIQPAE